MVCQLAYRQFKPITAGLLNIRMPHQHSNLSGGHILAAELLYAYEGVKSEMASSRTIIRAGGLSIGKSVLSFVITQLRQYILRFLRK